MPIQIVRDPALAVSNAMPGLTESLGVAQDEVLYKIAERVKSECGYDHGAQVFPSPNDSTRLCGDLPLRHRRSPRFQPNVSRPCVALRLSHH